MYLQIKEIFFLHAKNISLDNIINLKKDGLSNHPHSIMGE
jgi:hypothetical protein